MIGPDLPEMPQSLKSIQHYLRIASTHDERDPVVSYWCRLYALQTGLKLSTKTPKETNFLMKLMDWLEMRKKDLRDNEAITNDIAAQAHLENWALKLFVNADKSDRAGNFGKSVIHSFFTAGLLYDVLTVFGELSEEATQNRKYAKWKAAYIHSCLKNNETPVPGPPQDTDDNTDFDRNMEEDNTIAVSATGPREDGASRSDELTDVGDKASSDTPKSDTSAKGNIEEWSSDNRDHGTIMKTEGAIGRNFVKNEFETFTGTSGGTKLTVEQVNKVQKFIKWAGSALNYDDVPTTVLNLQKALHLLTTGEELT